MKPFGPFESVFPNLLFWVGMIVLFYVFLMVLFEPDSFRW